MRVSTDMYLYRTSRPLLMRVFGPPPIKDCNFSFYFVFLTHSCLLYPPHLTWTFGSLSTKQFIFLVRIWHTTAPKLALTSYVVKSIHRNKHTRSLDLCPRATSVGMPLPHRLVGLCRDLSRTCIGMFESLLLCPYYTNDLWTFFHHPNIGASLMPLQSVDHIGVLFKLFSDSLKQ